MASTFARTSRAVAETPELVREAFVLDDRW